MAVGGESVLWGKTLVFSKKTKTPIYVQFYCQTNNIVLIQ